MDELLLLNVLKVFAPATVSFVVGMLLTPLLTHYLYKHKMWKKQAKTKGLAGFDTPIFNKLHAGKEVGTPKMGGIVIWAAALITVLFFFLYAQLDGAFAEKMNLLSRAQTWLPLFTLLVGAIIGFIDDYFEVTQRLDYFAGGLSLKKRLLVVLLVSIVGAWWFFTKLEVTSILIPFVGEWNIGIWFIPFFILVMLGVYSGGVIDGIDGLAGGVFASAFAAYGTIAFFQNQIDLAAFSFVIVGGLLAFLWFNIPPARFYMAETGSMALTITLTVIAFLTQQVLILPIVAFPLAATTFSDIIQIASKKLRNGKKIFHVAPVHHHFEAIGWPGYKVTMRYWVLSIVFAIIGMLIALIG